MSSLNTLNWISTWNFLSLKCRDSSYQIIGLSFGKCFSYRAFLEDWEWRLWVKMSCSHPCWAVAGREYAWANVMYLSSGSLSRAWQWAKCRHEQSPWLRERRSVHTSAYNMPRRHCSRFVNFYVCWLSHWWVFHSGDGNTGLWAHLRVYSPVSVLYPILLLNKLLILHTAWILSTKLTKSGRAWARDLWRSSGWILPMELCSRVFGMCRRSAYLLHVRAEGCHCSETWMCYHSMGVIQGGWTPPDETITPPWKEAGWFGCWHAYPVRV